MIPSAAPNAPQPALGPMALFAATGAEMPENPGVPAEFAALLDARMASQAPALPAAGGKTDSKLGGKLGGNRTGKDLPPALPEAEVTEAQDTAEPEQRAADLLMPLPLPVPVPALQVTAPLLPVPPAEAQLPALTLEAPRQQPAPSRAKAEPQAPQPQGPAPVQLPGILPALGQPALGQPALGQPALVLQAARGPRAGSDDAQPAQPHDLTALVPTDASPADAGPQPVAPSPAAMASAFDTKPQVAAAAQAPIPQAPAPHDFAALIDRLVEAQDALRAAQPPQAVEAAIRHGEFGAVNLRFETDARGLSVALTSPDPEFAGAVQAALPAGGAAPGGNESPGNSQGQGQSAFGQGQQSQGHQPQGYPSQSQRPSFALRPGDPPPRSGQPGEAAGEHAPPQRGNGRFA